MKKSSGLRVVAMATEVAVRVRETGKAPGYGHPVHIEVATGYGPCRHCLRAFVEGVERRVLFTYDAFGGREQVPLPGPVFVHAEDCSRYPEDGGYPEGLRRFASVISGYGSGQRVLVQVHVEDGEQPGALWRMFEREDVLYAHVRDRSAGCFDFRVERGGEGVK